MANMRDVANAANVSLSTVSAVLSGKKYVSPRLSARVKGAIQLLGYDQCAGAAQPQSEGLNDVGLILPGIYSSYFQPLLSGIEDVAAAESYNVILCDSDRKWEKENLLLKRLVDRGVKNLILDSVCSAKNEASYYEDVLLPLVRERDIVLWMLSRESRYDEIGSVSIDHRETARQVTQYLIGMGHRHIAHISGSPKFAHSAYRVQGYREALMENGIPFDERLVLEGDFTPISGYATMSDLLSKGIHVSAVFSANDQMAIGAMKAILRNGLRIPEDIAVVGFDNLNVASLVTPGLTTVQYPIYQTGYCAMRAIVDMRHGKSVDMRRKLNTRLIVRRSSDPTQIDDWELNKW